MPTFEESPKSSDQTSPPEDRTSSRSSQTSDPVTEKNPSISRVTNIDLSKLPSRGMPYPKGSRVDYRVYTIGEEDELANSKLSMQDRYELVLRGITTTGFDKYDLLISDFTYISLLRKISTISDAKIKVVSNCPSCGARCYKVLSIAEVETTDLDIPDIPVVYEASDGQVLEFSPLTVKDFVFMLDNGFPLSDLSTAAIQCKNLTYRDAINYIANIMDHDDKYFINQITEMLVQEIKPVYLECKEELKEESTGLAKGTCNTRFRVSLNSEEECILLPFREPGVSRENKITFGKKGKHIPTRS